MSETPKSDAPKSEPGLRSNANAIRHGLKTGKLPGGCQYVERQMNNLRKQLEKAVLAVRGEVSIVDAAMIQTAVKWERHGALALRWLRLEADKLKPSERLQFSREIAKASSERDRAIEALDLEPDPDEQIFDALYGEPDEEAD